MAEPINEGLRAGRDLPRQANTSSSLDPSSEPESRPEPIIKPIDQIAPREGPPTPLPPLIRTQRTFRLSLRHSFNELLRPLTSLVPENDVIPAYVGGGQDILRCGHCQFAIAECVDIEQMRRQTLYCPRCGAENLVP
jgi:hypothetical protein